MSDCPVCGHVTPCGNYHGFDTMTPQPTSPRTAAGRALRQEFPKYEGTILRIEAEAAAEPTALLRALVGALDVYRAQWQTTSTGWGPVSEATAEARAYLKGQK